MFWSKFRDRIVYLQIRLLDEQDLDYDCKASVRGKEVLEFVVNWLRLSPEKEYFGLRYVDACDQVHWLDTDKPLKKQLKKCTEPYGTEPYKFYFGFKFYPAEPSQIKDERTRYQLFIQIKKDIFDGRLPVPSDAFAELAAYALQAETGDFDPIKHTPGYSSELDFAPGQTAGLEKQIESIHKTLRGQSEAEAESRFLSRAKCLDLYGVDLHPVLGPVQRDASSEYFLGLFSGGIMLVQDNEKLGIYPWNRIIKIDKDVGWATPGNKQKGGSLIIHCQNPGEREHAWGFCLLTKEACKHTWRTAVEHKLFFGHEEVRRPFSTRLFRLSSKFRSSSRAESDNTSTTSDRRGQIFSRQQSSFHSSARGQRIPSSSVAYRDDKIIICVAAPDTSNIEKLSNPKPPPVQKAQPGTLGRRTLTRRSESPMSIQSSFSTNPRRFYEPQLAEVENDDDSVFSSSSRMSRAISDAETLRRKRKRSAVQGENHSSGASEETDYGSAQPRVATRNSLGPQRRRGKAPMRHKTHDGSAIREALSQLNTQQSPNLNYAHQLATVIQPARSLNYLNSNTLNPPATPSAKLGKSFELKCDIKMKTSLSLTCSKKANFEFSLSPEKPFMNPMVIASPTLSTGFPYETACGKPVTFKGSFPRREEEPRVLAPDTQPRHVRSLSSSGNSTLPGFRPPCRSRIRSDSQFSVSNYRTPDNVTELPHAREEISPLLSPFPTIPPPSPFSEPPLEQVPPVVPPRPANTLSPRSKINSKKPGLNGNRNESFSVAVKNDDSIEMYPMRSSRRTDKMEDLQEPVYDAVYGTTGTHVVEVDVHRSWPGDNDTRDSWKNENDNFSDGLVGKDQRRETLRMSPPIMQSLLMDNQMYFDLSVEKENSAQQAPLTNGCDQSRVPPPLCRPIPLRSSQRNGLPLHSYVLNHPLALYSTGAENGSDYQYQQNGTAVSPKRSPVIEHPVCGNKPAASARLQRFYSDNSDYALYTDI